MIIDKNYIDSNNVITVRLNTFKASYTKDIILSGESVKERKEVAEKLLKYLCDKFKINHINLEILNKPQPTIKNGKKLGDYTNAKQRIRIFNLTAKTQKVVSIKSFYDTLIHEFIHHYDYEVLKYNNSLHTTGFYKRITDLKTKLSYKLAYINNYHYLCSIK